MISSIEIGFGAVTEVNARVPNIPEAARCGVQAILLDVPPQRVPARIPSQQPEWPKERDKPGSGQRRPREHVEVSRRADRHRQAEQPEDVRGASEDLDYGAGGGAGLSRGGGESDEP